MGNFGEKKAAKQKHHPCGDSKRNMLVSLRKFFEASVLG
jgi:hypothetical protein